MLDVLDFIAEKGGDPKRIKESQQRRHAPEAIVDDIIALFEDHKKTKYAATQIGSQINATQKEIGAKKKAKEDAVELLHKKATLEKEKKVLEESAAEKDALLTKKIRTIGNYVHESVPVSNNEDNNKLIRKWAPEGVSIEKRDCLSHHEVLTRIGGYDSERAVKIVGHRGYCLTGYGLFLNLALINYGLEFLWRKGYTPNQPPHFMLREYMAKTAQLEQFDEELYKVTDDGEKQTDKYLIATSEQPLSALHDGEWLQEKDLPIKYAGYSTCYRKEAGAHGKDAWGIFRVHQFEKIEQFLFTKPDDSWKAFDDMIAISEEFYQSLGIPYQVVAIVSGALNNAAAKKYDLEAWFPFQGEYKELVSCSNCTDYQARALDIRYGPKTQTDIKKNYVHALNSTLCATERAMCCVLETYQKENGVTVPEVLRKYIPGAPEFIEYTRDLPKDSTSQRNKPGQALPVR
ncbi:Cytosolic seryl-tRNA synthetase [Agyrium rufum]|nr:Cytosolic seryl-tRNA synthetase [Agyrium rufum]